MVYDKHTVRKAIVFVFACALMSLGVVISTKAVLGTSPISSIPFVLTLGTGLSIGTTTVIMNCVVVFLQVLVMGRMFRLTYMSQFIMLILFSSLCDVFTRLLDSLYFDQYILQWGLIIIAAAVLSFGISFELAANVTMMPGEYLVSFISIRSGVEFGKVKVMFDVSMIVIAALISILFFGTLNGVREGTIFAALVVGPMVRVYTKLLKSCGFYDWVGHVDISMVKKIKSPDEVC